MRERIESKHVTKEIKSQMPVIPVEIVKERGCTFCPYYLGNYEKQPRCMMKTCAWDDENERFHPINVPTSPHFRIHNPTRPHALVPKPLLKPLPGKQYLQ